MRGQGITVIKGTRTIRNLLHVNSLARCVWVSGFAFALSCVRFIIIFFLFPLRLQEDNGLFL